MITRKLTAFEVAQLVGTVLAIAGLVMILPLGWVLLIVGVLGAGLATWAEHRTPPPIPTTPTEGD
jgi:hypothetical protein